MTTEAWRTFIEWAEKDCGIDAAGAETLIRLAASIADEKAHPTPAPTRTSRDDYTEVLSSFSEPVDVDALAVRVGGRLYRD